VVVDHLDWLHGHLIADHLLSTQRRLTSMPLISRRVSFT
jgi:hypothetical protein